MDNVSAISRRVFDAVPGYRRFQEQVSTEKGYMRAFTIEVAELGKLPRSPITGTVARLVDRRVL